MINEIKSKVFIIDAISGNNGSISPEGQITIEEGKNQNFGMNPDQGYEVNDVLVDGSSVGDVNNYNFKKVKKDHTIRVTFKSK